VNKSKLALVAVGEKYIEPVNKVVNGFFDRWDIHVLTDNVGHIPLKCHVKSHEDKIFSYFEKMLFVLRLVEKYKTGVLYVDVDRVDEFGEELMNKMIDDDNVTIINYWHGTNKNFKGIYDSSNHFKPLIEYCEKNNIDYDVDTFSEEIFYVPYFDNISDIIYDVEKLRPVFEYQSLISIETNMYYPNVGNAEGLALSISLKKNNRTIKKI
jgi:hypothetical protein